MFEVAQFDRVHLRGPGWYAELMGVRDIPISSRFQVTP